MFIKNLKFSTIFFTAVSNIMRRLRYCIEIEPDVRERTGKILLENLIRLATHLLLTDVPAERKERGRILPAKNNFIVVQCVACDERLREN